MIASHGKFITEMTEGIPEPSLQAAQSGICGSPHHILSSPQCYTQLKLRQTGPQSPSMHHGYVGALNPSLPSLALQLLPL